MSDHAAADRVRHVRRAGEFMTGASGRSPHDGRWGGSPDLTAELPPELAGQDHPNHEDTT